MSKLHKLVIAILIIFILLYIWLSCNWNTVTKSECQSYFTYGPRTQILKQNYSTDFGNMKYPVIMKPNIKSGRCQSVKKISNAREASNYMSNFDWSFNDEIIIQDFCEGQSEVSVLIERTPGKNDCHIVSVVKYVNPNANSRLSFSDKVKKISLKERNNYFIDITNSPIVTNKIKQILIDEANKIPGLYVTKFDIIIGSDEEFANGENINIIEANGRQGTDLRTNAYLFRNPVKSVYYHLRWMFKRFYIGSVCIWRGESLNLLDFVGSLIKRMKVCQHVGHIDTFLTEY